MGALSIQVLQELFVSLTRKLPSPVDVATARSIVADLATWRVVEPRTMHILSAIEAAHRWQVSFWDAMILTSRPAGRRAVVWTEDLNRWHDRQQPLFDDAATRRRSRRRGAARCP